jgi:hypothetical protein
VRTATSFCSTASASSRPTSRHRRPQQHPARARRARRRADRRRVDHLRRRRRLRRRQLHHPRDFAGSTSGQSSRSPSEGDGHNVFRVDLTLGANFDDGRGNAVFGVGYQEADPVFFGARDIAQFTCSARPPVSLRRLGRLRVPTRFSSPAPAASSRSTRRHCSGSAVRLFNFNPFNIFQTPFERFNIFGAGITRSPTSSKSIRAASSRRTRSTRSSRRPASSERTRRCRSRQPVPERSSEYSSSALSPTSIDDARPAGPDRRLHRGQHHR